MDVEPEPSREQRLRDQQAVGGDDDRVAGELELRRRPLGLQHRDPQPLGDDLRGRRGELAAAPGGLSGRVSSAATSCRAASRSSTSAPKGAVAATADPHGASAASRTRFCAASRAPRCAPRRRRALEHEHAVEVVELVLDDARVHLLELELRAALP